MKEYTNYTHIRTLSIVIESGYPKQTYFCRRHFLFVTKRLLFVFFFKFCSHGSQISSQWNSLIGYLLCMIKDSEMIWHIKYLNNDIAEWTACCKHTWAKSVLCWIENDVIFLEIFFFLLFVKKVFFCGRRNKDSSRLHLIIVL